MPIFIGDVHGKFNRYKTIIKEHRNTIQVGDLGVGFISPNGKPSSNPPFDLMVAQNARFIRGNHDNPKVCYHHQMSISDGTVKDDMMFCGGAYSIDRIYRTEGFDWWPDEQLNEEQLKVIQGIYIVSKPNCMVTHDCPWNIYGMLHSHHFVDKPQRTPIAFEEMFQVHKPKLWVFGHHHKSFDAIVDGTRFVCLAELEVKELTWDK